MIKQEFIKISAGGNDFIVVDNRKKIFNTEQQEHLVERMCARHFSIGADGACFIESSNDADYFAKFFSADGAEQDFNGNSIRAAMRFAEDTNIASAVQRIETKSGILSGEVFEELISVKVPDVQVIEMKKELDIPHQFESKRIELSYVDFGSRHLVMKLDKVLTFDVYNVGNMLSNHKIFQPDGVNITFFDIVDSHNLNVSTFEFGVKGLVNTSGDGAVAAFIIAEALKEVSAPTIIHYPGGLIKVYRDKDALSIEGEARIAFRGYITADMLNFDIEKARKRYYV
jgi:diaminopimelate epimerase